MSEDIFQAEFYDPAFAPNIDDFELKLNFLHELGHVFNARTVFLTQNSDSLVNPYDDLTNAVIENDAGENITHTHEGFQQPNPNSTSPYWPYRQNANTSNRETFADMFLNTVLGTYADDTAGQNRNEWMLNQFPEWFKRFENEKWGMIQ